MDKTVAVFFLTEAKERVIGRIDWIYGISSILAKSLNNRINRNQTLTVFWSRNIKKNPVFGDRHRKTLRRNKDGVYRARILRCFNSVEAADEHLRRFRNNLPAEYSHSRLVEQPYPDNPPNGTVGTDDSTSDSDTSSTHDNTATPSRRIVSAVGSAKAADDDCVLPTFTDTIDIPSDTEDDLICLSSDVDLMAHSPIVSHRFNMKKDSISSHFSFDLKSNGDRVYEIDGKKHVMPSKVVVTLEAWNTAVQHFNDERTDRRFAELLLVCFIGSKKLAAGNFNRKVLRFVQDIYRFRVKDDSDRMEKFTGYLADKRQAMKELILNI